MDQRGMTVVEAVVVLILIGLATAVALPAFDDAHRNAALRAVTETIRSQMWRARAHATTTGAATALVFDHLDDGRWHCRIVQDGDGDGIRRSDITAGRDLPIDRLVELEADRAGLGFIPEGPIPDPDGSGTLGGNLDDPVRAGAGDILTFTAQGTSTSATLYFTDGRDRMRAIRIFGVTGRFRTLKWRVGEERWAVTGL